jgi:protein-S-isoprenylcysteine O-methyltransferase Ste14
MTERRETGLRRVLAPPVRTLVAVGVLLLLVGIGVSIAAGSGANTVLLVAGLVCVGLGAVALVSAFFYAVGRSEDEDRARHPMG